MEIIYVKKMENIKNNNKVGSPILKKKKENKSKLFYTCWRSVNVF